MIAYKVVGQQKLGGEITPSGNKNAALPIIAACLLTKDEVVLSNVPEISDVHVQLTILEKLGAVVERDLVKKQVKIQVKDLKRTFLTPADTNKTRGSILFLGGILGRAGEVELSTPGGCNLGKRPIDSYLDAIQQLGGDVDMQEERITVKLKNASGARVWLNEKAVTGTENVIMASVISKGNTEIINAASEPHVQDLCNFLITLGAKISGVGSDHLYIEGVDELHGGEYRIIPDFMEIGTFMALGAVSSSKIVIHEAIPGHMVQVINEYQKLGAKFEVDEKNQIITTIPGSKLVSKPYRDGTMNKIECLPWPGFPADLMQFVIIMATQAEGRILIHDKLYEGRFFYTSELVKMGADIFMADPHRIIVSGKTSLTGEKLQSPDIRAGMSLLMAALIAEGESVIERAEIIERGYEKIEERFRALGANITRVEL